MGDRNHHKDKTLVLRILVPSLETAIRDKMAAAENQNTSSSQKTLEDMSASKFSTASSQSHSSRGMILDLEGVSIEPASLHPIHTSSNSKNSIKDDNHSRSSSSDPTLWKFQCDGAVYPARLVNLPCPVELHKTQDHAMYYKSVDIAQMLIIYEDMQALEEVESSPGYSNDDFPTYYHSGLTPPMHRVVQRRFALREHKTIPPPSAEIAQVEKEIIALIELLTTKDSTKKTKSSLQSPPSNKSLSQDRIIVQEEIEDEIVDYEPWMDDYGRSPQGIEFDEREDICKRHPELWLSPQHYTQLLDEMHGKTNRGIAIPATGSATATATSSTVVTRGNNTTSTTKIKTSKTLSGISNHPSDITLAGSTSLIEASTDMKKPKKKKKKDSVLDSTIPHSNTINTSSTLMMSNNPKDHEVFDDVLRMDEKDALDLFEDLFDGEFPL